MAQGIFDSAAANKPAVLATATSPETAESPGNDGVHGDSLHGDSLHGTGVSGVSHLAGLHEHPFYSGGPGVYGENRLFNAVGVWGDADAGSGSGVVGKGNHGVEGQGNIGVVGWGHITTGDAAGVAAFSNNSDVRALLAFDTIIFGSYAGWFSGATLVAGDFSVSGTKSAIVPYPDGSHRRLYCMESPESWFEDFGIGQLHEGLAEVHLDHDFAALVHTDSYRVFLTPYGDSNGLFVAHIRPNSFTVREQQAGKHSLEFAYRVVARRRDVTVTRLEPFQMPVPPVAPARPPQARHHQPQRA